MPDDNEALHLDIDGEKHHSIDLMYPPYDAPGSVTVGHSCVRAADAGAITAGKEDGK